MIIPVLRAELRLKILIFICLSLFFSKAYTQSKFEESLNKLNQKVLLKDKYDHLKLQRINHLEKALRASGNQPVAVKYEFYSKLYDEYKSYNYDKAFFYAQRMLSSAKALRDPVKVAEGKINLGFVLLSAGMVKETFDSLSTVEVKVLPKELKRDYYYLNAHTYYDLADYDKDNYYAPLYNKKAVKYIDSALALSSPLSYDYQYNMGLKLIKMGRIREASGYFKNLMANYSLTNHQLAVTYSTLSDIYIQNNNLDEAIILLLKAAEADINSSTKEAAAMLNLAMLLYKKGDVKNAYAFINQAMDDATYYGARHRKLQVSNALIVIAGGKVNLVEQQRKSLVIYASLLTILIAIVILFAVIITRQLKKLRKADKMIIEANTSLQENVRKLTEAEKVKEEYIGYYFNLISEYITKLDRFKKSVSNKLVTKKYDDIQKIVNNINLNQEREQLFLNFDKAFLTLYPDFVETYNSFFEPEHQVKLKPGQLMNTDLRIFALVRLGINETEKISSILEYSMNTIYNYKARIKNKSRIPNEEFETAILSINAW
jgi:tetratricopeptide (TPR) repeat protein